ncbi:MAG TPA: type 4a pilus biogenesis protein PilO [Thermoanaerobacterales bacterium]|jgi:Tfp pilus assembly protein PilO|nr:type 4a pilus biogenesis protein PilO [Thermoanaerobacterales bacterium]
MRLLLLMIKRPLSKREKTLFYLLIFCIILWGIFFIVIPKTNEVNDLKYKLNTIKRERLEYKQLYNNPKDYTNILNRYDELIKKIPKNIGLSEFLIDIEKWATESDLNIISIYPQQMDNTAGFIIFEITLNGSFTSIVNFIDTLENHTRIIEIYEVKLNTISGVTNSYDSVWELKVNVKLYFLI